jgi:transcriptional regulator with XRE-family HTH domain
LDVKIGNKIKVLRKRDDVTQERLAEALGLTSQAAACPNTLKKLLTLPLGKRL